MKKQYRNRIIAAMRRPTSGPAALQWAEEEIEFVTALLFSDDAAPSVRDARVWMSMLGEAQRIRLVAGRLGVLRSGSK